MLNFTMKIIVITLSIFLLFSCDETSVQNDYLIVISDNSKIGENLELTVNEKDKLIDYTWVLEYELGNKVTSCNSLNTPVINCTLEEGGEVRVKLTAKNRNGDAVTLYKKFNVIDTDLPLNQAPVIVLSLQSESNSEAIVSTNHSKEKGIVSFPVNEEITFDFSETTDDTNANTELKYELKIDDGQFETITNPYKYTFTKTGYFNLTLNVTDANENTAVKKFVAFISCSDNTVNLNVDYTKVSITPDSIHNFFTYDASNAVTGGDPATYRYRWDYNGDGVYDSDWLEESSIREYTVFKGIRNVKLKVWEQACNNVKEVSLTELDPNLYDFDIILADAIPGTLQGPQIPGYFFIQGYPEGKDGFKSTITDVDFIATKADSSPPEEQWRVLCDYRPNDGKATISIKGLNQYERVSKDGELHGVLLTLDDIDISGFSDLTTNTLSNLNANVDKLNYYSDEEYDKLSRVVYRNEGECVSQLTLMVTRAAGSCVSGSSTFEDVITIDGTYSCENLKGTNGKNISVKKGAFYCEVGPADACIGGGGGGGGVPPEEF
jgi:hypothetical protein